MLLSLNLVRDSRTPLYHQIYEQIRGMIVQGELSAGSRLPASRQLAHHYGLARVTVTAAYEQLRLEGFLESRTGAGTFVTAALPKLMHTPPIRATSFEPELSSWGRRAQLSGRSGLATSGSNRVQIDFGFGRSFPHIFPYDIWRRLLARYLSTDDTMLSRYGSSAGFTPLRKAVATHLRRLRGVNCDVEQVVIVSGMQQALDILARLLLDEGDRVLVETPGYASAFELFRTYGADLKPLAVDDEGFPVERIPSDCRACFVFVTPSNQFPKGGTMPLARRVTLLQWARKNQALVLEDDYDGELRYSGRPLAALQGLDHDGRVVYLGTFSKVLFPALRLGYVVLPWTLLGPFLQAKELIDRGAPTLTQAAVADFITEGHFERHLRRLRKEYGRRRQVLVEALEQHLPGRVRYSSEEAGLHVMLYLLNGCDEAGVVRRAALAGVGVYPGAPYHLEQPAPPSILMGFSGLNAREIRAGVERLATAIGQDAPGAHSESAL